MWILRVFIIFFPNFHKFLCALWIFIDDDWFFLCTKWNRLKLFQLLISGFRRRTFEKTTRFGHRQTTGSVSHRQRGRYNCRTRTQQTTAKMERYQLTGLGYPVSCNGSGTKTHRESGHTDNVHGCTIKLNKSWFPEVLITDDRWYTETLRPSCRYKPTVDWFRVGW